MFEKSLLHLLSLKKKKKKSSQLSVFVLFSHLSYSNVNGVFL